MKLDKIQTQSLIKNYFYFKHRFPAGTDIYKWENITMKEMEFDDPPLPGNKTFEKQKISDEIINQFLLLDITIESPLNLLADDSKSMKDLWQFCYKTQGEIK